jgi:hypothetical protein
VKWSVAILIRKARVAAAELEKHLHGIQVAALDGTKQCGTTPVILRVSDISQKLLDPSRISKIGCLSFGTARVGGVRVLNDH